MYHGAEHKTIFCYENGLELTVENVRKMSRFHPRCGTAFMFVMLILSIIIVTLLSLVVPAELKQNTIVWMLINYNILSLKTNIIWRCYYLCSDKFINHNDICF